jgi:UDP-N-acetylglucosamine diphosphorylase/glucosamine-1-phosphate N-acetyltransferase
VSLKKFATIIMAAGKGTRMKSDLVKVLHQINNRPMVHYVIDLAKKVGSEKTILVIGHQKEKVIKVCHNMDVQFAIQEEQLGTGHAVQITEELLKNYQGDILVLSGDVPLLKVETIKRLIIKHNESNAIVTLLTAEIDNPAGYGRIIRNHEGNILRIIEHKDATPEELQIKEINVGIYIFKKDELFQTLKLIKNDNVQGEYYLPDVVKLYVDRREKVVPLLTPDFNETRGINTLGQLKLAETILLNSS